MTLQAYVHLVSRSFDLDTITFRNHQSGLEVSLPRSEWESIGSPNLMRVGLTVA